MRRLHEVTLDSQKSWGTMTPHQMICHLNDSFKAGTGEKEVGSSTSFLSRTLVKWLALYLPIPWPHGVATRPEMDQNRGGTQPLEFRRDLMDLETLIERFSQRQRDFEWHRHPLFDEMSDRDWWRWGYLHVDHHLRQFGV
ncbi:MAG: DUF1569 domain-containing protein [Acidobacteriota bacterium]